MTDAVPFRILMTASQRRKLKRLGGVKWIRSVVDAESDSESHEALKDPVQFYCFLSPKQHQKLKALGGGPWIRTLLGTDEEQHEQNPLQEAMNAWR